MNEETRAFRGGRRPRWIGHVEMMAGDEFAGHRIESEIGRGGMGVVFRARHLALDRERALKLIAAPLSADPRFRKRFERESRLAASIEHPNVVPVHHAGEERGLLYLSMRLVEGADLRRIVELDGPLPVARAASLVDGVASGLDAAHARGLVHRDVKPANVLIEAGVGEERVFLTDFGISRTAGAGGTITSSGELLGSPDYVAPEQIEGDRVDGRADVYAFGCLLHFLLTGRPPFARDNDLAKLFAHANAPRPRPSELADGVPEAVDDVVGRAMAIRPADRYASAGELAEDFEGLVTGSARAGGRTPIGADPSAATRRLQRPSVRRRPVIAALAALALLAAGVAAALLIASGGERGEPHPSVTPPRPVATVKVGRALVGLTVGDLNIWVTSRGTHSVYAIDPKADRQAHPPYRTGGRPVSVAVGFGSIWVVDSARDSLLRLDPAQGRAPTPIAVGAHPTDVAIGSGWVWVTNAGGDSVTRIDPSTNRVDATIRAGAAPTSVASGNGSVWVTNTDGGSVSKIDGQTGAVVGKPIPVGQQPNDVAVGGGFVWVTDVFSGTVSRIDPGSAKVVAKPVEVGARPRGVKTGFGYAWVANGGDGTVTRIDPAAGSAAGPPIPVGKNPADIAVGKGAVWTANYDDSTVTKIRP